MRILKVLAWGTAFGIALSAATPSFAVVNYTGFGGIFNTMGLPGFVSVFSYDSPGYITSERRVIYGPGGTDGSTGGCFYGSLFASSGCYSTRFQPHVTINGTLGDYVTANFEASGQPSASALFAFPDGSFGADNSYAGSFTFGQNSGPAQLTVTSGPDAPGPLLGAGLLPALASVCGLFATRLRRRKAVTA